MPQNKSGYLDLDGGKIYYEMAGEGDTLVLVHAGFVDSGMWDGQWQEFSKQYHVVRYDMLGFGKSDRAKGPLARRQELYNVVKHLGIEQAHLLGCSMGGAVVIDFTLEHPEMVLSLTPISAVPSGFQMQGQPPAEMLQMMEATQKGELDRVADLQIRIWVDGPFRKPEQVDPAARKRAAEMNRIVVNNSTFVIADAQAADPLTPPAVGRLSEIHAPTLV